MTMRIVLIVVLLAVGLRFGILAWNGYRRGQVKSASLWGQLVDRQTQPRLYWAAMTVHTFVVVVFVGSAVALAFGWAPNSN